MITDSMSYTTLDQEIAAICKQTHRENANVGHGPSSKLLQIAELANQEYSATLLPTEIKEAIASNILYPHDFSWYSVGTTTCTFIPLRKLLERGFHTGHGFIRSPKRIRTATQLACIIFQSNQNDQHGGQAFGWFDRDLAPYVQREFTWQLQHLQELFASSGSEKPLTVQELEGLAWNATKDETFQAMEGLIFNLNSMHARAGAQVPFTSINFGTDISKEGRLVSEMLLRAYDRGLGYGEQPLFPNLIFKVKKSVNFEEFSPNYDLFQLSLRVTGHRLFPNYVFQDCTLNQDFPEDVPVMGCRTRIAWDRYQDEATQTCEGRGNLSFTTLNLPGLALSLKKRKTPSTLDRETFAQLKQLYSILLPTRFLEDPIIQTYFIELFQALQLAIQQLHLRFQYQASFSKHDFPFLMNGVWMDSDQLKREENLEPVLRHGSLAVGFIGLAEALIVLCGEHHGESPLANELGLSIIQFMRTVLDAASEEYQLNYSLLATPAEGLCGKLLERDRQQYGMIDGVTDHDWYTNSFHVPVNYPISIFGKIGVEGPYHRYCNGGQISYIELKEAPRNNPQALERILHAMSVSDMGYVAFNFPVDHCLDCHYDGIIEDACPECHSHHISRIRRITGYLAEFDNFNKAKRAETEQRVAHGEGK
ncbi:anaerobic ribonucleoside-triphosphate reductase [Rubeoparvulum massiliense]|uniref:anaerobic ribonucleoside-triphosphate reductase n=1 Tax=Rubeoparvulum massiliense TaxID=1631346 RepID=UPI00065E9310|nr:anaerobic ribonucleoside-triphosphate reductase [Rubeoparvulum massiliense]